MPLPRTRRSNSPDATDTPEATPSSPDDVSAMRSAVKRAIGETIAEAARGGATTPSPALLALLREACAVLRADDLQHAKLLMTAGLLHDLGHDVDGANACYAEGAVVRPHVAYGGPLARVRKVLVRNRGQKAREVRLASAVGASPTPRSASSSAQRR